MRPRVGNRLRDKFEPPVEPPESWQIVKNVPRDEGASPFAHSTTYEDRVASTILPGAGFPGQTSEPAASRLPLPPLAGKNGVIRRASSVAPGILIRGGY